MTFNPAKETRKESSNCVVTKVQNENQQSTRSSSSTSASDNDQNKTEVFELKSPNENSAKRLNLMEKQEIDISETHGVRLGKCKWFNFAKGWGFITPNDGGQEVFVHQSVLQMSGFRSLGEQEEVEFECKLTDRGLEATRVSGLEGKDCTGSLYRSRRKKRFRRIRCYNCGAFANHIAAKCSLGPQPKRCHNCKSESHLVAECPDKKIEKTQTFEGASEHKDGDEDAEC